MNESDRIAATAAALLAAVREAGHVVTGDGRVAEAVAAQLLGISQVHLRRLRQHGELQAFRAGVNGSRVSYRLAELARWIETTADEISASSDHN